MSLVIWEGHGDPDGRLGFLLSLLALEVNLSDRRDESIDARFTLLINIREKRYVVCCRHSDTCGSNTCALSYPLVGNVVYGFVTQEKNPD